jgi:hypothetical protein
VPPNCGATVAVKVIACPNVDGLSEDVRLELLVAGNTV